MENWIFSIIIPSEIITCWFAAQGTLFIISNVENSSYFCGKSDAFFSGFFESPKKKKKKTHQTLERF